MQSWMELKYLSLTLCSLFLYLSVTTYRQKVILAVHSLLTNLGVSVHPGSTALPLQDQTLTVHPFPQVII